jgi:hypothetical protein
MLSIPEKQVFGVDAQLHPITGMPIEQGSGALHPDSQAVGHWGQMTYELAALTQRRAELARNLENAIVERSGMAVAGQMRTPAGARQLSVYELAAQDTVVRNLQIQVAAAATEHEALAVKIAEVHAMLTEEGVFERHGAVAASTWFGEIRNKGWAIPKT